MPEFVKAISTAELAPGACTEVNVGGKLVALFNVEGTFYALSNTCVHRGGPLGQGMLEGCAVVCPWHAWTYDVRTGVSTVNPSLSVARYDVKVEEDAVFVRVE